MSLKGYKQTEEHKKKAGEAKKGFKHTDESKQKMREARIGRFTGEGHPMFGKNHSEETKKK